jgi:hypothetical protein
MALFNDPCGPFPEVDVGGHRSITGALGVHQDIPAILSPRLHKVSEMLFKPIPRHVLHNKISPAIQSVIAYGCPSCSVTDEPAFQDHVMSARRFLFLEKFMVPVVPTNSNVTVYVFWK